MSSIPSAYWQVKADDPLALTRILNLPALRVQRIEYDDALQRLIVVGEHAWATAYCPNCKTVSEQVHQ